MWQNVAIFLTESSPFGAGPYHISIGKPDMVVVIIFVFSDN